MRIATLILAVCFLGEIVHADPPPPTSQAAPLTVMVLPFQQLGDTSTYGWVAQALQEDLLGQVARTGLLQPKAFEKPVIGSDAATALQVGRDNGATLVIFGSYQVISDQLRVTAQAADVPSGKIVGGLQVTGDVHDLFKLEDSLGAQLAQVLPQTQQPGGPMPTVTYGTPDQSGNYNTAVAYPDGSSPYVYIAPQYAPAYAYPDYAYPDYGYPYYYGPVFFNGGFFFNHFHSHPFIHGMGSHSHGR
jgi:TolB-like protein